MAYPNTRVIRYEEDGKTWDGTFVEQSRTEITAADTIRETLVNEGIDPEIAAQATAILAANEII